MQRNCIFPGRYAPLTYYDWLRGRPRNTLMARKPLQIRMRVRTIYGSLYLQSLLV